MERKLPGGTNISAGLKARGSTLEHEEIISPDKIFRCINFSSSLEYSSMYGLVGFMQRAHYRDFRGNNVVRHKYVLEKWISVMTNDNLILLDFVHDKKGTRFPGAYFSMNLTLPSSPSQPIFVFKVVLLPIGIAPTRLVIS